MRFAERQLRLALVVLLAGAAVLLAVGAALERHQNADQSQAAAVTRASGAAAAAGETGETGGEGGAEAGSAHAPAATGEQHGSGERFFGVAESLPLTIVAVVVSVALALAVWARPDRLVVWLVLVAVVVLAAADARELVHHLREARPAVATIAAVLLGMHVVAAGAAALLIARERSAASRVLTP
jgi:hypothetical protein